MHFDAKNFSPTHSWQQWWKSSIHCGVQLRENGLPFCWGIFFEENYDWFCPNLAKKKKKSALGKTFPSINSVMRERKVLTIRPAIHQKSPLKYELVKITNHNFSGLFKCLKDQKFETVNTLISKVGKLVTKRFIIVKIHTKIRGFPDLLHEGNVTHFTGIISAKTFYFFIFRVEFNNFLRILQHPG